MSKRKKQELQFAVCINNEGYEVSLEKGKLYRVIPDEEAAKLQPQPVARIFRHGELLRVADDARTEVPVSRG